MSSTDTCTHCGAQLGQGRFCAHCGRAVERERPRVVVPPTAVTTPPQARFPLFADEAEETEEAPGPTGAAAYDEVEADPPRHRDPRGAASWLPWVVGLVVVLLIGGGGLWLLTSEGDDSSTAIDSSEPAARDRQPGRDRPRDREPSPSPTPTPTETAPPDTDEPSDLARFTTVSAPEPAEPSQDNSGNVVRYVVDHLVDGVPETTWRTPGDATGASITFSFEEPAVLGEVGLVNGYAKIGQDAEGPLDWYHGNRRVLAVEWAFDDGTTLTQELADTTVVQRLPVDGVETGTVTLTLLEVSEPGPGRASRDYTAISDVSLVGTLAG